MALTKIKADGLTADLIDETKLADNSIDSEHYNDGSIDNAHLADDAVGVAELSATGTASSSTFLRGDNSWATPTDTNTQLAFANDGDNRIITGTGSGGLNGEANLTYDGTTLKNQVAAENGTIAQFELSGQTNNPALLIKADESDEQITFRAGSSTSTYPSIAFDMGTVGDSVVIQNNGKVNIKTSGDTYLRVTGDRGNSNDLHIGNLEFENANNSQGVIAEIRAITGDSGTQNTKGQLAFHTDDGSSYAERARITSSGHLKINDGNLVIGTAGKGIDFSVNSNGPGTSESELFHIYEEGYYTPTISANLTLDSSYNTFQYTRVGRLVTVRGLVVPSSWSGNDAIYLSLPFAALNDADSANAGASGCMFRYIDGCTGGLASYIGDNTSYMYFYRCEANNGAYNALSNDELNTNAVIYFSHTYAAV